MRNALLYVLFGALLTLAACSRGKERLIREKVADRVNDYRKRRLAECQASLLTDAEKIVDSLLLHEALNEVNDSLRGMRPFKPLPPGAIAPIDSGVVKPIFDQ